MARLWERLDERDRAVAQYQKIVERNPDQSSRAAIEAYRRLMQLEFGLPLETAERVAAERERGERQSGRGSR
jgi:hypothetical protein